MTYQQISELARDALADIARRDKGHVIASRPGICAGAFRGKVMFRREGSSVHMEIWQWDAPHESRCRIYDLPHDLKNQTALMLDNL